MSDNHNELLDDMLSDDFDDFRDIEEDEDSFDLDDDSEDNSELVIEEERPYGDEPAEVDDTDTASPLIDDMIDDDDDEWGLNDTGSNDSQDDDSDVDSDYRTPQNSTESRPAGSNVAGGATTPEYDDSPLKDRVWIPERLKDIGHNNLVDSSEKATFVDPEIERADPIEEKYTPTTRKPEPQVNTSDPRTPLDKWTQSEPDDKRPRWVRDTEALQKKETEFFLNAGTALTFARFQRSPIDDLRGPLALRESAEEKKKRMKKIGRIVATREEYRRGKRSPGFSMRDYEILQFLAMFRMAKTSHIANIHSRSTKGTQGKMLELREKGLVFARHVADEDLWFLTESGIALSGYDVPTAQAMQYRYASLPHYYGINHVASNLWSCNFNVLNEDPFPVYNRRNNEGKPIMGETMVSEHLVRSALGRITRTDSADVYRPVIMDRIDKKFKAWEDAGGPEFGPSPEMVRGNEYMWVLFPPSVLRHAFHVTDLIIQRERNADGSPNSIAVEVELGNKNEDSYRKILQSFYHDRRIFGKVIWICKRGSTAKKLNKIGEEIGLLQEGRLEVIPFLRDEGSTRGLDFQFI